ncbi:MAG: hypothetical protein IPH98_14985 [Saprospiraceae bacterium]|nr:hypothetical protein [Candidatus Defluviibacterium haderslevense]
MLNLRFTLIAISLCGLFACNQKQTSEIHDNYKKYYDQFNVEGSFVLFDPQANKYIFTTRTNLSRLFSSINF